jgi:hypothetical protein
MMNLLDSPKLSHSAEYDVLSNSHKYKFEQGGMLVYDINSNVLRSNTEAFPIDPVEEVTKTDVRCKGISEEDWKILKRLKTLPVSPEFRAKYNLYIPDDGITLEFNSKFESGNLYKAVKLSDYEYSLQISADMNTTGNNHWYYFSCRNPRKTPVTFRITNMKKLDLLYRLGQKPAVFSSTLQREQGIEWHRDGCNVSYTQVGRSEYYCLAFTYSFRYENDLVLFAYSIPYSYTRLVDDMEILQVQYPNILRVNTLCKSILGNACPIITITEDIRTFINYQEEQQDWNTSTGGRRLKRIKKQKELDEKHKNKKSIVITARVHPGETVSSFMMKGVIKKLVQDSRSSKILRKNFVFKLVPMLNPDGVRYGNYRCSLLGVDLNRRWAKPSKILHPTIFYTKKMIQVLNETHPVTLFCDMHGHSRKKNVFMYGCNEKGSEFEIYKKNLLAKFIPVLLAGENKLFSFNDCHFRIEKDKLSTARIVVFRELNIFHSYTIEASFFGPKYEKQFAGRGTGDLHMNEEHLGSIGESLCRTFLPFCSPQLFWTKLRTVNDFLKTRSQKMMKPTSLLKNSEKTEETFLCNENLQGVDELSESLENSAQFKAEDLRDDLWTQLDIVQDQPSEDDSGGSDSCPSERGSLEQRSKSAIRKVSRATTIKKSTSNSKFQRPESEISSDFSKIVKAAPAKISIVPKFKVPKLSVNLPVVSPKVVENMKSERMVIPPVNSHRKPEYIPISVDKQHSLNVIKRKTVKDLLKCEMQSYSEVKSYKPMITPRNYKLLTISWMGINPKEFARRVANELRYQKIK